MGRAALVRHVSHLLAWLTYCWTERRLGPLLPPLVSTTLTNALDTSTHSDQLHDHARSRCLELWMPLRPSTPLDVLVAWSVHRNRGTPQIQSP